MRYILLTPLILFISSTANSKVVEMASIPHYIQAAATLFRVDPALMYAICKVESQCRSTAKNHDDGTKEQKALGLRIPSHGLFQIKLGTARGLEFKGTPAQLRQPGVNSYYAAKLLRNLYDRRDCKNDTLRVLSAYNAGSYTKNNNSYVVKVLKEYAHIRIDKRS